MHAPISTPGKKRDTRRRHSRLDLVPMALLSCYPCSKLWMTLWISSLLRMTKNERSILVLRARRFFWSRGLENYWKTSWKSGQNERLEGSGVENKENERNIWVLWRVLLLFFFSFPPTFSKGDALGVGKTLRIRL